MNLGLAGKSFLVTGATGQIGQAIVRTLATEGAHVAIHYRGDRDTAESLAEETGGHPVAADLRDEKEVAALVAAATKRFDRLDGLVAGAGRWPVPPVPVADMPLDRWTATIGDNLTITFLTCREYLRHLRRTGDGAIVLIASAAGRFGEAGHADYAAAKAAVAYGLALSLKNEMVRDAPHARINVVSPGWTPPPEKPAATDPALLNRAMSTVALNKPAKAQDVANAVAWLLSPVTAGHLTGEVIGVTGGMEGRLLHLP
ncbi:SDR family NAD(P)-dependent oxidoreductase [Rhizohabitans arisaemae]|uniref:SDR family NAD(P)-dependent oxidoreductase n=1 Tax=Rhizohabitans arisaemae TaxID=2720610 RepID=UPI0024B0F5A4|nr:SDR family oxidoreductase [Rhizohabitans arisaemae]